MKHKVKILILTNGDYGDYDFCREVKIYDSIICADNGLRHARKLNITPQYILGDFDSCSKEELLYYKEQGIPVVPYPSHKDETDTELAIHKAVALGATHIDIWGGLGSRFDHTLANVHLMYKAFNQGIKVRLLSGQNTVQLMDKKLQLEGKKGDLISLLPYTPIVKGVHTKNLMYPVEGGSFEMGKPYGVSNVFLGDWAEVSIEEGLLLVVQAKDEP